MQKQLHTWFSVESFNLKIIAKKKQGEIQKKNLSKSKYVRKDQKAHRTDMYQEKTIISLPQYIDLFFLDIWFGRDNRLQIEPTN